MNERLDIDKFGEIMEKIIEKFHVQMLIEMPEGTNEPEIADNIGLGGVVQLYILLAALKPIYKDIYEKVLDHNKQEDFIDAILAIVKTELMSVVEEEDT